MFFQLGTRQYNGLKSFVSFGEDSEAVVVEYALIGRKPRLQGVANTLTLINISFFFHQEFCNVKEEIAALKKSKSEYEILPLLSGTGEVMGEFVITQISIDRSQMDDMGNTIAADVSISLKENVQEDKQAQLQQNAVKNSFATGNKQPATKSNRKNTPTCNKTVSGYMSTISSNAAYVNKFCMSYSAFFSPTSTIACLQAMYKALTSLYNGVSGGSLSCVKSSVLSTINTCMSDDTTLQNLLRSNFGNALADKDVINYANSSLQKDVAILKSQLSSNITSSILNK